MVAEWHAFVPPSDEPPVPPSGEPLVTPPPPEDHPEQVIEADPVINLEEGDGSGDDLEGINDPQGNSGSPGGLRS